MLYFSDSSELNGVAPSEQVCSPSECSAETHTTLFQSSTCPPCPTEKECPSIPTCPTKPTYPVGLPCKVDLGILLDSSSEISRVEYKEMIGFLRDQLVPMWIIGTQSTEVALGIYSDEKMVWKSNNFSYMDNSELLHDLEDLSNEESLGSPSLQRALAEMRSIVNNRRVDTKLVTIVFTSTSNQADIDASMDDAKALTKDDDTLIMVGINEQIDMRLLSTLNAFAVQGSSFDDKIALQINSAICIGKPNPLPSSTSTPSTTPISTQPRPNANLPCNIDVGVYLDGSTAISRAEYAQEVRFLQEKLAKKWYVSPSWTDVSIGAYGSDGAPWFGGFWYNEAESYEIDLKNMSNIGPLGPPSVERHIILPLLTFFCSVSLRKALIATKWLIENRQRYMHVAAYILFTYTSNETDLSAAKPYADYVATSGNDLIVVGMGSEFNANTLQNTLGLQPIISTTYSDALADEIADAICKGKTTVPTRPPRPGLGCDVDVLIAMDLSEVVPANSYSNQFNFLRDQVVSTWNINPWETEVAVGMFQGGMASFGAYAFRYANDAAFDEIFSLYATKTPHYTTNIAFGMQNIRNQIEGERRQGKRVVALVFVYSAQQADIEAAQPFAEQIVSNGDRLVIIAVGSSANVDLFRMLSNETLQLIDFNDNAANQASEMISIPIIHSLTFAHLHMLQNNNEEFVLHLHHRL
uniref:VWFA domain-containing protein n=1 Tax=Ascaris lumbricoides TaxID=6252 RepID=A0A9J2Q8Y0_ASCLU